MADWTRELIHGGHEQSQSALKDGDGYCCLGLMEHKTLHIPFPEGKNSDIFGNYTLPGSKVAALSGVGKSLTAEEVQAFKRLHQAVQNEEDVYVYDGDADQRMHVLAGLNDSLSLTFREIGIVVALMGWDVEEDENFVGKVENYG